MKQFKNPGSTMTEISQMIDNLHNYIEKFTLELKIKEKELAELTGRSLIFSEGYEKYFVGIVDMVNSTSITEQMSDREMSEFYQVFINSLNDVIIKFNGTIPKNIGDSLIFYFPLQDSELDGALNCLKCCIELQKEHLLLQTRLDERNLPSVDYRISATFGTVNLAKTSSSNIPDIFGATVNKCAKLNRVARKNGIIIGQNFYNILKNTEYKFEKDTLSTDNYTYTAYHLL